MSRPARKRAPKKPAPQPFATAQVCPLGIDLWGNFPDGSMYMLTLSWPEVAALAKKRGKRITGKGGIEKLMDKIGDTLPIRRLPAPASAILADAPLFPWDHRNIR